MLSDSDNAIIGGIHDFLSYAIGSHPGYYKNFFVTHFNSTGSQTYSTSDWTNVLGALQFGGGADTGCEAQLTLKALKDTIGHSEFVPGSQVFVFTNSPFGNDTDMELQKLIALKRPKVYYSL